MVRPTAQQAYNASTPHFNEERPSDIHQPSRTHRYGYYIRALTTQLEIVSKDLAVQPGGAVLDYGCADLPYRRFFPDDVNYVGTDLPGNPAASVQLNQDGTVPVEDGVFDVVLSTQVLEHVADPALYLSECFRALRRGGRMMLSTHGMFVYHPDPEDYWRWTAAGLKATIRDAGFEIKRLEGVVGLLPMALQLAQDAVYWKLPARLRPMLAVVMQTLIALTDRLHGDGSRRMNASVYVVIAEKP